MDTSDREALIQQLRAQSLNDRQRFRGAENTKPESKNESEVPATGTFRIRLALAGVLLLSVILLDRNGKSVAGISMDQIFTQIGIDTIGEISDWLIP